MRSSTIVLVLVLGCQAREDSLATTVGGRRELVLREQGEDIGTITYACSPLPDGGERWSATSTAVAFPHEPYAVPILVTTEEVIDFDASLGFVRSTLVVRELDRELRSELVREGDELHVHVVSPWQDEDRRLPLPADFTRELADFRTMVAEAKAGASLPRSRTHSLFDQEQMAFEPRTLTLRARTTMTVEGATIDAWEVTSAGASGDRTATHDDLGLPLRFESEATSALLVGAAR